MKRKAIIWIAFILTIFLLAGCTAKAKENDGSSSQPEPAPIEKDPIAEQLENMTLDEKIGQMLIAGIDGYAINDNEIKLIQDYYIGGFILYSRNVETPGQLVELTNSIKKINVSNKIPLFISVDEEGGRISRLPKAVTNLPANKVIGKINSKELSYEIGLLLAEKVQTFGLNMNFAPVLDINSNPKNPVIGDRAFGSEVDLVSRLGVQTMKGIRAGGIIPVIKHFPGHGDTTVDSHLGLPSVNNDLDRLRSFELIPFKNAIDNDADVVMVAHILLPKIDAENPASLSKTIISGILRQQLQFEGVVITDDITMGAITKNYDLATAAIQAVKAGNDIILVAHKYENALIIFQTLKNVVIEGLITEERINQSVYRILALKQKYNLQDKEIKPADIYEINERINDTLKKYK